MAAGDFRPPGSQRTLPAYHATRMAGRPSGSSKNSDSQTTIRTASLEIRQCGFQPGLIHRQYASSASARAQVPAVTIAVGLRGDLCWKGWKTAAC
jgi:hypothetical protein